MVEGATAAGLKFPATLTGLIYDEAECKSKQGRPCEKFERYDNTECC